ncbi:hypothetical protein PICSAR164_03822 [Mycobacterium avium subsp. paratuberculosis]|nr:hypothetical protein PICSAR164_03822 [Mycobacterium avium subsp. paratuberculosis]
MPVLGRCVRGSLVEHLGDPVGQRAVDAVGVSGDPADVGGAPEHVGVGLDVEDVIVRVGGLGQIAAAGVHDALGLAGGARGVQQKQRLLGGERLGGVFGRGGVDDVVPPQVAAAGPGHVNSGAPHHHNVLDRAVGVGDRLVGGVLERRGLAAAELPVAGDQQLGCRVGDAGLQRLGGEAGEHHAVHDAQPRAGQHRDHRLGDQRQIDGDAVAGDQTEIGQRVGGLAHLRVQLGIGQTALIAGRFALPVDGDPVAVAGLHVAVHAVVGDVERAVGEPLGERRPGPVQHLGERCGPGQPVGLLGPERQPVPLGLAVQLLIRIGLLDELRRRRIRRGACGVAGGHGLHSWVEASTVREPSLTW